MNQDWFVVCLAAGKWNPVQKGLAVTGNTETWSLMRRERMAGRDSRPESN